MDEKIAVEISKRTYELLLKTKREDETIEDHLLDLLGFAGNETTTRRLLLLGMPAAGKSSIRRFFFEDTSPQILLENPLEPTRGIENYTYNWLDVTAGIADSSGQEIERWLGAEQEIAFGESDSVIFVVDMGTFAKDHSTVFTKLVEALEIREKIAPKAQFSIFLNKMDTLPESEREVALEKAKAQILRFLQESHPQLEATFLNFYYTSIKGPHILSLIKAMRSVLYSFSKIMRRALIPYSLRT